MNWEQKRKRMQEVASEVGATFKEETFEDNNKRMTVTAREGKEQKNGNR